MQPRRLLCFSLLLILVSLLLITSQAFAVRVLYDDFSAGSIDVHRWPRGMLVREIRGGALTSELSALANRSNYIMFKNPESVNSIQATVTVTEAGLLNQQSYGVYAQIAGNFYKGLNGDIFAGVCIGQQVDQGLEAWWVFYDGSDWQLEVLVPPDDPNPLLLNTPYVAKIEYNGFEFEKIGGLWHTNWQKNGQMFTLSLRYNPEEVEAVPLLGEITEIFNQKQIYLSFDPTANSSEFKYIALANSELAACANFFNSMCLACHSFNKLCNTC